MTGPRSLRHQGEASTRVADRSGPSYPLWISQLPQLFQHDGSYSPRIRAFRRAPGEIEDAAMSSGRSRGFRRDPSKSLPLRLSRRLSPFRAALPELRCPSYHRCALSQEKHPAFSGSRLSAPSQRRRRHFLRSRLLTLAVLGWAAGPVRIGVRTHCRGLVSLATLCSLSTTPHQVVGASPSTPGHVLAKTWPF